MASTRSVVCRVCREVEPRLVVVGRRPPLAVDHVVVAVQVAVGGDVLAVGQGQVGQEQKCVFGKHC